MRLIDADTLADKFEQLKGEESLASMFAEEMVKAVEAQPTAYDLDKVVEDLEELRDGNYDFNCCPYKDTNISCDKCHMIRAIDVVRSGGYLV